MEGHARRDPEPGKWERLKVQLKRVVNRLEGFLAVLDYWNEIVPFCSKDRFSGFCIDKANGEGS